jgi:hypothetical protein
VNIFCSNYYEKSWVLIILHTQIQILPMKNSTHGITSSRSLQEKKSETLLMQKMGMSKKEIREVYLKYGVSASKLVELMQLSKYQFVYTGKVEGQCEPCTTISKLQPAL